jgi:hypothetical protein
MDMEALQRIIKKSSNDLIDLNKSSGEGSSNPNKLFRFPPKKDETSPPTNKISTPRSYGINMEDIVGIYKLR